MEKASALRKHATPISHSYRVMRAALPHLSRSSPDRIEFFGDVPRIVYQGAGSRLRISAVIGLSIG